MGSVTPHPKTEYEISGYMAEKRAGAFFFQPKPEPRSLVELAETAGMEQPAYEKLADEPGAEVVTGFWGGLFGIARLRDHPDHVALEIYFSINGFVGLYDGRDPEPTELPLEDDPALPLAIEFRDACLRLHAQVGFLTLSNIVANTDYMAREIYPKVRTWDAYALADQASLLYVADALKYNLFDMPGIEDRDQIPVEDGMLLFSQQGPRRWY